jgi:hypothetical protein
MTPRLVKAPKNAHDDVIRTELFRSRREELVLHLFAEDVQRSRNACRCSVVCEVEGAASPGFSVV